MSKKLTTSEFIEKAKKIHDDKYNYSDIIYNKRNEKIKIKCPIHGDFYQYPYSHLEGKGCFKCGGTSKLTNNEFIRKSTEKHFKKYDYSKINYISSHKNVIIICPIHGEFIQKPYSHLNGKGCPICGGTKKLTTEEFIIKAKKIHGEKYDYSLVNYINNRIKVIIRCKNHGIFNQKPNYHLMGEKCPKCSNRISKPEIEFLDYLKINLKNRQIQILNKSVDGFDSKTNTIYEFLGDYYHGNPKIYNSHKQNPTIKKLFGELYNDTIKRFNNLKKQGYNIKYIWESDWKRFKNKEDDIPNIILYS